MEKSMIQKLIAVVFVMAAFTATASEFDNGSPEFEALPNVNMTEAEIQRRISEEMEIACQNNLCRIVGTDSSGESFEVAFNIGYGDQNGDGDGSVVVVGNTGNSNDDGDNFYAGITITYRTYSCQSNLRVTPAVYRFVNTYLYNMVGADGSVRRNFSPADQTVILFYTTMLNKVASCSGGN